MDTAAGLEQRRWSRRVPLRSAAAACAARGARASADR